MLIKGGDWFVDASVWTARITGLPEVIIGATIVSMATTLPELFVSSIASLEGHPDMAIGNVVGSVICNTGLILGLTTLISPARIINPRIFCLNGFLLAACGFVIYLMAGDGIIRGLDSVLLLLMFFLYLVINIAVIRYKKADRRIRHNGRTPFGIRDIMVNTVKFVVGIALIMLGADMLVEYGSTIAVLIGVPAGVISLTIIALGTSLPELATSLSALLKGHKFISMGNIIGANILNFCMVLGVSSYFGDIPIKPSTLYLDLPVSILLMAVLLVPCIIKKKTTRLQSAVLVAVYAAYILLLGHIHL
jgi:cation:H+ antiporter